MENPQKSLDSSRQRFAQLVAALRAFDNTLRTSGDNLPPWSTLQSHFNVLSSTLDSLSHHLSTHFPSNSNVSLVSYPLPSFPASQGKELLLATLLNKKLNPAVSESILKAIHSATTSPPPLSSNDLDILWNNCREILAEQQDDRNWYDDLYTLEEREMGIENVETGLKGLSDAGEVEQKEMVKEEKGLSLESMLRFMGTGVLPKDQPPLPQGAPGAQGGMKR